MEKTFRIVDRQQLPPEISSLVSSFRPGGAKPDFEMPGHFTWHGDRAVASVKNISRMATGHLAVYRSDDMKAEFFERHAGHDETFNVLPGGAMVTILGFSTDTDKPDFDKLWAFVIKEGEILRVPADWWHCVPYSLKSDKTFVAITYNPDQATELWHVPEGDSVIIKSA